MRRLFPVGVIAGSLMVLTPQPVAAQSVTESSDVIGRGVLQFETGMSLGRDGQGDDRTRTLTTPELLVRVGVNDRVELLVGGDGFVSETVHTATGPERASGHSDTEIGAKVKLFGADTAGVDIAVLPSLVLPTGKEGFTSGGYDPGVTLAWARELPRGFGLSGNLNMASITSDGVRAWERVVSVSLAHELSESWSAYSEGYGFLSDGSCDCGIDAGVTRTVGPNAEFNIEVGRGVSSDATDWSFGVGFTVSRFGLR